MCVLVSIDLISFGEYRRNMWNEVKIFTSTSSSWFCEIIFAALLILLVGVQSTIQDAKCAISLIASILICNFQYSWNAQQSCWQYSDPLHYPCKEEEVGLLLKSFHKTSSPARIFSQLARTGLNIFGEAFTNN